MNNYQTLYSPNSQVKKTEYELELQTLKSWDSVQDTAPYRNGYDKIYTAGHGYLLVPKGDKNYKKARLVLAGSGYGFKGRLAIYLEEDCEIGDFFEAIK